MAWPRTPSAVSRRQAFDDLVLDTLEALERRHGGPLGVEVLVADVPDADAAPWLTRVELTRELPGEQDGPPRLVVYRRPCETRAADDDELAVILHETLLEEVSRLAGLDPEDLD